MPFDPVVAELQMMAPAEAATNQVSAVSYFFIPPSAEKRNPVKIHHLVNALRNETWEIALARPHRSPLVTTTAFLETDAA